MARIKRGEVWIANLDPGFGTEIRKKRPVLIVSNNTINAYWPKVIAVPITTKIYYPGPEKVSIENDGGLKQQSDVLTSEIRSVDKTRLVKKVGKISKEKLYEIEDALVLVLGLKQTD